MNRIIWCGYIFTSIDANQGWTLADKVQTSTRSNQYSSHNTTAPRQLLTLEKPRTMIPQGDSVARLLATYGSIDLTG
jgi:hypothetical protein